MNLFSFLPHPKVLCCEMAILGYINVFRFAGWKMGCFGLFLSGHIFVVTANSYVSLVLLVVCSCLVFDESCFVSALYQIVTQTLPRL